jgi:hypothetical protein
MAAKKKIAGLDQVIDRLKSDLDKLIADLVEQRVKEAFAAVQGIALGKTKAQGAGAGASKKARVSAEDAQAAVLGALQVAEVPMAVKAIREATGLANAPVTGALKALLMTGAVGKTGEKRATVYFLGDGVPASGGGKGKGSKKKTEK